MTEGTKQQSRVPAFNVGRQGQALGRDVLCNTESGLEAGGFLTRLSSGDWHRFRYRLSLSRAQRNFDFLKGVHGDNNFSFYPSVS
ncbi:uncharacterized protein LAJ45_05482 [Morchella importuna]|uniref:uncharacterized protein n=1 Tax=Morchella importuna TaxID=1174673 RepID=UPI001E8D2EC4|nr:uncharacterized protein LAJ45_05482 [Morchella importuna]KAH8150271.1 hypothetical protein LAJ45_05482 [Morchella importuna]